jgi:predicted transcriptional regulator
MTRVRDQVIELIKTLPEDSTLEDIHYHLYVREKVEHGLKAIDEGRLVSQAAAEKRVQGWLKSSGPNPH